MTRPPNHNAHVRARASLLSRIVSRHYDWHACWPRWRGSWKGKRARRAAAKALARFEWPQTWGAPRGVDVHPILGPARYVERKTIPAHVVHMIMCEMRPEDMQ